MESPRDDPASLKLRRRSRRLLPKGLLITHRLPFTSPPQRGGVGRGAGVGRDLGVGIGLGVDVGRGVAVGVGVGVGVGV